MIERGIADRGPRFVVIEEVVHDALEVFVVADVLGGPRVGLETVLEVVDHEAQRAPRYCLYPCRGPSLVRTRT